MAGVLAGVGTMVLVFGFDMLFFKPLATPELLSGALLGGDAETVLARLRVARIGIFTVLHLAVFTLLGIVLARFFSLTRIRKTALAGAAYGLIICTLVFAASLQLSGTHMSSETGWMAILGANIVAGVIMQVFLRVVQGSDSG